MTSKVLLTVAIPTYNRAALLENLLNNITFQLPGLQNKVQILISNNASSDNTREVAMRFKKKYPDLIKYNENETNLGYDRNILKLIFLSEGKFIWTFSDDDLMAEDGLKRVVNFITGLENKNIGGIVVKDVSYRIEKETGEKIKYHSSVDNKKPEAYRETAVNNILQGNVPYRFVSVLIFNSQLLKEMMAENPEFVEKGISSLYFHSWLYLLLFVLKREAEFWIMNQEIVVSPDALPRYKFIMEDHFELIYRGNYKFFNDLLSIVAKTDKEVLRAIKKKKQRSNFGLILAMFSFKTFGLANFVSGAKCIRLAFKHFPFLNAVMISLSLAVILIIPSFIIKKLYKIYLKIRFGAEAESVWLETYTQFTYWDSSQISQRVIR